MDLLTALKEGKLSYNDLSSDQVEELIGEMAIKDSEWIPLCPVYPNLKGVTCNVIETYKHNKVQKSKSCSKLYDNYSRYLSEILKTPLPDLILKYESSGEKLTNITESGDIVKEPIIDTLKKIMDWYPELRINDLIDEDGKINPPKNDFDEMKLPHLKALLAYYVDPKIHSYLEESRNLKRSGNNCPLAFDYSGGSPYIATQSHILESTSKELDEIVKDLTTRDYFNRVKVFDRDEIYDILRKLGIQLNNGIDLEYEVYKEWKKSKSSYMDKTPTPTLEGMKNDEEWRGYKRTSNYIYDRKRIAKKLGIEDYFTDNSTVFITTPRGGYEALSIFSYANDLKKDNIPSDIVFGRQNAIKWRKEDLERIKSKISEIESGMESGSIPEEDGIHLLESYSKELRDIQKSIKDLKNEIYGENWLGGMSSDIKRVVIVDDIVESGEQLLKTIRNIHDKFNRPVEIKSIAICGRREPVESFKYRYFNPKTGEIVDLGYDEEPPEGFVRPTDVALYGYEVLDMDRWRECVDNGNCTTELATCAFPWHISDSRPSQYLRELLKSQDVGGRSMKNE